MCKQPVQPGKFWEIHSIDELADIQGSTAPATEETDEMETPKISRVMSKKEGIVTANVVSGGEPKNANVISQQDDAKTVQHKKRVHLAFRIDA